MSDAKIVGYKKIFGFILPDWVTERMIRFAAGSLLAVFAMFITYVFVIDPKFDDIKELEANVASDKAALAAIKISRDGINKIQTDLTPAEQERILAAIPSFYSPENAIFILRELASKTGVSIISYSLPSGVLLDTNVAETIGKKGEMVDFFSYPIKITLSAPVDVLLNFITKAESSLPYGLVSDLNLQEVTKLSKQAINKNVQLALEIRYYQSILHKVNVNKIKPFTDKNMETSQKLRSFELINLDDREVVASESSQFATASGDIFGI